MARVREWDQQQILTNAAAIREFQSLPAWHVFSAFLERYEESNANDALDDIDDGTRGMAYWRGRRDVLMDLRGSIDKLLELADDIKAGQEQKAPYSLSRSGGSLSTSRS